MLRKKSENSLVQRKADRLRESKKKAGGTTRMLEEKIKEKGQVVWRGVCGKSM